MVVTKARDNVIEQLGGKVPLEVLRETVMGMAWLAIVDRHGQPNQRAGFRCRAD